MSTGFIAYANMDGGHAVITIYNRTPFQTKEEAEKFIEEHKNNKSFIDGYIEEANKIKYDT
ncbi:hypothetical protein V7128_02115 [Neobacillus vireti]|uniref:hypothetical protein n=1 Tax=Neobacillus vireti TaxID=220686 RepID=UPI0030006044